MDEIEQLQDEIDKLEETVWNLECDIADLKQEISILEDQPLERPSSVDLLKLDPDPYGYHGISLQTRMEAMNLCKQKQNLRLS